MFPRLPGECSHPYRALTAGVFDFPFVVFDHHKLGDKNLRTNDLRQNLPPLTLITIMPLARLAFLLLVVVVYCTLLQADESVPISTTTTTSASSSTVDVTYPNVTLTKIAFGSCHKRKYAQPSRLWQRIQQQEGQAWLWMGDAVYPPQRAVCPVNMLQEEYQHLRHNDGGYAALVAAKTPYIWGTWDDHDYGGNDMGKEMPDKVARRNAFWDFLGYDHAPRDDTTRQGVYHAITVGQVPHQVKIIMLDTRTYRDNHCGIPSLATKFPLGAGVACLTRWMAAGLGASYCGRYHHNATMLGEQQWTWLQKELATSEAAVHIVVSSVQVLSTNPVRV